MGKNNVGKTSLLAVLNFLYITNKNEWNFDHDPKTTLNYYFNKLDKHYIIFEIYKNSYFSILIRRNDNNELEYFVINTSYDEVEKDFFSSNKALLSFENVSTNLLNNIKKLSRKEFAELVFGASRRDKSVIWLSEGSNQKRFSKIYKYLLNTKLISNQKVKESLLIADKKEKEQREFSATDSKQIEDIKKHQRDISALLSVKKDFLAFQEIVSEYEAKSGKLNGLYHGFEKLYNDESLVLKEQQLLLADDIRAIKKDKEQPLIEEKNELSEAIGSVKTALDYKQKELISKHDAIRKIEKYDPLNFLELTLLSLEKNKKKLDYTLSLIENEGYTEQKIATVVEEHKEEIAILNKSIDNFENLLIHHISKDEEMKKVLNIILSDKVLKLDKEKIEKIISASSKKGMLELFDGEIDISSLSAQEFTTIDSLKEERSAKEKALLKVEELAENIANSKKIEDEVSALTLKIKEVDGKIEALKSLPKAKEVLEVLTSDYDGLLEKEKEVLAAQKMNKENLKAIGQLLGEKRKALDTTENRKFEITRYFIGFESELKALSLNFEEPVIEENIDRVTIDIRLLKESVNRLKYKKDTIFHKLKERLRKEHSSEQLFIQEVEEELHAIDDKEKAINEIINSIANNISQPTKEFLKQLEYFESYVKTVSRKFKKYKISDLDSVEVVLVPNEGLIHDLKLISQIDRTALFNSVEDLDYNQQLEVLKKYIAESKKIMLSDLFDIRFLINNKSVNMSKQTESNGTDRILKITLFLVIMQDLFVQDEANKLVIYVDELGEVDDENIKGFIARCKENNFIPIFAGPDKKPNIAKYYDLLALKNKQIVVDESRAMYVKSRV